MTPTEDEALAARAAERLARPGAWLDSCAGGYGVRIGPDRRRRPLLVLDEAGFRRLAAAPGLRARSQGGWVLAAAPPAHPAPPPPGRPGVIEGERMVAEADGRLVARRANLGASALAWLAARRDGEGRPWLDARRLAAAERLALDHERAGVIGRLTMSWDAGPRGSGRRSGAFDPAEHAQAAKTRLAAALAALAEKERAVVARIVLREEPLAAVERDLRLPRRSARRVLQAGLAGLADHYRL